MKQEKVIVISGDVNKRSDEQMDWITDRADQLWEEGYRVVNAYYARGEHHMVMQLKDPE